VTLALLFYGSLIGPVVALALLTYLAVTLMRGQSSTTSGSRRATLRGLVLACFVCTLLFSPQLLSIVRDPDYAGARFRTVFLFSDPSARNDPVGMVTGQLFKTLRSFILFDPSLGFGRYSG